MTQRFTAQELMEWFDLHVVHEDAGYGIGRPDRTGHIRFTALFPTGHEAMMYLEQHQEELMKQYNWTVAA